LRRNFCSARKNYEHAKAACELENALSKRRRLPSKPNSESQSYKQDSKFNMAYTDAFFIERLMMRTSLSPQPHLEGDKGRATKSRSLQKGQREKAPAAKVG
jgi:hypothetical protein